MDKHNKTNKSVSLDNAMSKDKSAGNIWVLVDEKKDDALGGWLMKMRVSHTIENST